MNLTDQQIARFVEQGGFTGGDRATAIAVVLAESGGNSAARGDTSLETSVWGPSIGLFQIRSLWAQRGTGGQRDEVANLDPATNARHAHQISWTPAPDSPRGARSPMARTSPSLVVLARPPVTAADQS